MPDTDTPTLTGCDPLGCPCLCHYRDPATLVAHDCANATRMTGCPWPTGIHRFVDGECSRCGKTDPKPPRNHPTATQEAEEAPRRAWCQADGCGGVHEATYSHEGRFGEGPVYAVVCPVDNLTDYYTTEGLANAPATAFMDSPRRPE